MRALEEKNVRYLEVIGGGFNSEPALRATQLRESKRNHEAPPINFDELTDLLEQAEIQLDQKTNENSLLQEEISNLRKDLAQNNNRLESLSRSEERELAVCQRELDALK